MAAPAGWPAAVGPHRPALDPCAALQRRVTLDPGATVEVRFLLGQAGYRRGGRALIRATARRPVDTMLAKVTQHWTDLLAPCRSSRPTARWTSC
jgi:cyclic beta-1,2-glucan synthetase